MMNSPFRLDEGYSEDTRSQSEGDAMRVDPVPATTEEKAESQLELPDWVKNLSEVQRSEFAYAILRSLRTSSIAAIVERLTPLLHIDFVQYLPAEITLEILSYLETPMLLRCSIVSKAWRERALDSRLWMDLFAREGWSSNVRELRKFREAASLQAGKGKGKATRPRRVRSRDDDALHAQKKRVREGGLFGDGGSSGAMVGVRTGEDSTGPESWAAQHGDVEADEPLVADNDVRMQDVSFDAQPFGDMSMVLSPPSGYQPYPPSIMDPAHGNRTPVTYRYQQRTPLVIRQPDQEPRLNWQHLYKQKRRLEKNWALGKYRNFQLPHPRHPEEAHAECVYTIQYSGKFLVSGSRDKTLRIWDLETQRLVRPALEGHDASVLCLQFDERPEEDVIISGGSDCCVILWKFSTGEMIKKIKKAHTESVLNLRFDERYLVTCSKDKTIRVWNRRDLLPTDEAYPSSTKEGGSLAKFPAYIINMKEAVEHQYLHTKPLKPYSLLMTLYGHTAAVNAIQILKNEIVSASGDRSIKLWNIKNGHCVRTFTGHSKGIACVQYDGRRIVSGSSDETVRIFDRETAAEVACLRGHTVLVRTVQANFGDQPGNEAELAAQAKAIDEDFFKARDAGAVPTRLTREQRRARNAGSSDPQALFAHGAKIPPGGGGTPWGRIVSGSYDETVIVWKRDEKGKWVISHRLQQTEAVTAAGGGARNARAATPPTGRRNQTHGAVLHPGLNANQAQPNANGNTPQVQAASALVSIAPTPGTSTPQQSSNPPPRRSASHLSMVANDGSSASAATSSTGAGPAPQQAIQAVAHLQVPGAYPQIAPRPEPSSSQQLAPQHSSHNQQLHNLQAQLNNPHNAGPVSQPQAGSSTAGSTSHATPEPPTITANTLPSTPIQAPAATSTPPPAPVPHHVHHNPPQNLPPHHLHQFQAQQNALQTQQANQQQAQPHAHHHHHHHHHHGNAVVPGGMNSRVFKLQFDARRIICCSQDPTIVGWDFADGDWEIEEASRFFGEEG